MIDSIDVTPEADDGMHEFVESLPPPPNHDAAPSGEPAELPMIVWLRGDEDYADAFNMDAEKAMETLGIKRSRLTQISGRELRVGRIRVDRYIRPMYRMEDLLAYQKWSRATATHLKASSVIENAAAKLADHSHQLSEIFKSSLAELALDLDKNIDDLKNFYHQKDQSLKDHLSETNRQTLAAINEYLQATALTFENRLALIQQEFSELQKHLPFISQIKSLAEANQTELMQAQDKLQTTHKMLDERSAEMQKEQAALGNFNRDVGKALSLIIQFQRDTSKRQDQLAEGLDNVKQMLTELRDQKMPSAPTAVWHYRPSRRKRSP